jgi:molybdenum cofactor guanylyltransferase
MGVDTPREQEEREVPLRFASGTSDVKTMEGVGETHPLFFWIVASMITDVTGVLLAGGKSRRMGEDKRFLSVGEGTLFERSLAVLRSVFDMVVVVIAQDSPALSADVPVYRDLIPSGGSLGGLYTGLKMAVTPYVFVVGSDMPFLNPAAVHYVTDVKSDYDVVMAKLENGLQPMHALYHRRCLPIMEELMKAHELKIQQLASHPALRVRLITPVEFDRIDPQARSFFNVNTPSDLETARSIQTKATDGSSS